MTGFLIGLFLVAVAAAAGFFLGTLMGANRARAKDAPAVALLHEGLSKRINDLEDLVELQRQAAAEFQASIDQLTEQRDSLDKKLKNTQGLIAKALSQRDFWAEWYHRQASEHGAAQQYLLQELELHVKRGSKHPLNEPLKALVAEFGQNHPALADSGAAARAGDVPFAER